ncbi:Uncharacterized protein GBIM_01889 [Gryllus bimaculatus]|nr:Uncharacterized protein GBIM_01889 [Gryllus bimaculatus]
MANSESERVLSYTRLYPDESPMIMNRHMPTSQGSSSHIAAPIAAPSEHYVRRRNVSNERTELPLDDIGFFALVTFSWMAVFIKKSLPSESLTTAKLDSSNLNGQRLKDFLRDENVRRGQTNARMMRTAWRFVQTRIIVSSIIYTLGSAMYIIGLVFFLSWFRQTHEIHFLLVLVLMCSSALLLQFWSESMTFRTANRLQSAFMSVMYKHLLRISILHPVSAHRIVTAMAADSQRVHDAVMCLPVLLSTPVILMLPIPMLLLKIDCDVRREDFYLLARLSNVWKSRMSIYTSKRLISLQELLLHIPLVKMTLREKLFHRNAEDLREKECQYMKKVNLCDGFTVSFLHIVPLVVVILLWYQREDITLKEDVTVRRNCNADRVLVLECLMKRTSRKPINHLIALSAIEATYVIRKPSTRGVKRQSRRCDCCRCTCVCGHREIDDVEMQAKTVLKEINFEAPKERLIGICGDTSSGKTALIWALLGQINPVYGSDKLLRDGTYAYVGQNPWIMEATLRENVLFNEPFIHKRYYHVIHCCSLNDDIGQLSGGDQTLISESTLTLGQKQRIALARALYANRQFLKLCDEIFVLKDAAIIEHGTHDCLMEMDLYPLLIKSYLQEESNKNIEDEKSYNASFGTIKSQNGRETPNLAESVVRIPDSMEDEIEQESVAMVAKYNNSMGFYKTLALETKSSVPLLTSLIFTLICVLCALTVIISPVIILECLTENSTRYVIALAFFFIILVSRTVGTVLFDQVTYKISLQVHQSWIESICKGCLNIFQNASHSEILRWFSLHLSEIDTSLPSNSILLVENLFLVLLLICVLSICSLWFLIPIIAICVFSHFLLRFTNSALLKFYHRAEEACLRLNGFVASTVMGRVTIQAFGKEQDYWTVFHNQCDTFLAYSQLNQAACLWLRFWIQFASFPLLTFLL